MESIINSDRKIIYFKKNTHAWKLLKYEPSELYEGMTRCAEIYYSSLYHFSIS